MARITRNILIGGKRTSFRLEAPFWEALMVYAREKEAALDDLVADIVGGIGENRSTMASALRVFLILHFHDMAEGAPRHDTA
jgi:predicted DNA-binding ribbon-helix-helix protein